MTGWRSADVVVVGSGPAGASAALAAVTHAPGLDVLLLDRAEFPRDKACGDGVADGVRGLLEPYGVDPCTGWAPVPRLRLALGEHTVERTMRTPAWVVPRAVFDARLHEAAVRAGARFERVRVRGGAPDGRGDGVRAGGAQGKGRQGVRLDCGPAGVVTARVVVAADGWGSVLRDLAPVRRGPVGFALRGYAPVAAGRAGVQEIVFGTERQPSYAWSFDRGDGLANVGYGEVLHAGRTALPKAELVASLERLLPGASEGGDAWRGAHLPLTASSWHPPRGPVLPVGDAAALVNPLTGEGIYYAVLTGLRAGAAAAAACLAGRPDTAGERYAVSLPSSWAAHHRQAAAVARLTRSTRVVRVGVGAAARSQRVFDDLVALGLEDGRVSLATAAVVGRGLVRPRR